MLRYLLGPVFAATLALPALAAPVTIDLTNSSPSEDGAGWDATFNSAHGTNTKPFIFRFVSADATALPLAATGTCGTSGACVRLTAGTSPPFSTPKECTTPIPGGGLEPEFDATTAGSCYYRLDSSGGYTDVVIYHLGLLEASANIRVEIQNLTPALPFHTFTDFDSNTAPNGPPQPIAARPQANLGLVIDKSGSMGWSNNPLQPGCEVTGPPPAGCEPTRWAVLTRGLGQMATVAKAYILPGDQIAAVAFDTSSHTIQNLIGANTPTIDGIVTSINSTLSPGGGTSIGDGVDALDNVLAANAGENNLMMLFSDGIQNNPVYLRLVGDILRLNPNSNSDTGANIQDVPTGFDLCIFALRAEGTADPLDLQAISDVRCQDEMGAGLLVETTSVDPGDPELVTFFLEVLNRALIGDKLELVDIASHQLVRDTGPDTLTHSFSIGRDSISFTALLGWQRPGNGLAAMTLVKDGITIDIASAHRSEGGSDHWAMTLRAPAYGEDASGRRIRIDDLGGDWTLVARPVFEVSRVFDATTTIISDNATIATTFNVREASPGLNKPFRLRAELTEAGQPVTGLPNGSVRATVRAPQGNRGDVLARLKITPKVNIPDSDPFSAAAAKALTALGVSGPGDELRKALSQASGITYDLKETDPGIYLAETDSSVFEGVYNITFQVDAPDSKLNGPFQRVFRTDFVKSLLIDEKRTLASIAVKPAQVCPAGLTCSTLTFTPQDANGVLVGPAFATAIAVGGNAEQIGAVVDNLDGSYQVVVGCPAGTTCNPTISLRDATFVRELDGGSAPQTDRAWDVKMICGGIEKPGGPLAPGLYHTVVNLLATGGGGRVTLRFAPAIPDGKPQDLGSLSLAAGQAMAIDCARLVGGYRDLRKSGFVEGMLTIGARANLAVSAVYSATAAEGKKEPGTWVPALQVSPIPPRVTR
ncbi:VWA domain-containing protein [Roseibium marinum]|uniref:von Willebrand factor type A domain-containing protein n=1 Tax=Roseibium marinum TaxID=281252 RepID=A0A2S3UMY1_9HYPH|nr:VWA domain-containing protein [Roseibium marinum]POF29077.1 von Willebrand factor type A domain-containing protein [Roseibium marinum]